MRGDAVRHPWCIVSRIVKENGAEGGGFLPSWDGDTSTLGNREGVFEAGKIPFWEKVGERPLSKTKDEP